RQRTWQWACDATCEAAFEEHAQNGVRRETVPYRLVVRTAPFALLRNTPEVVDNKRPQKIATSAAHGIGTAPRVPVPLVPHHAGAPLLRNTRKTECGAKQFLTSWWCAPHPLRYEGISEGSAFGV